MGVMVSEVYDALLAAGAPEDKARAAAESIPIGEHLATKADIQAEIAKLETRMVKTGIALVGVAVVLNNFLQWIIR